MQSRGCSLSAINVRRQNILAKLIFIVVIFLKLILSICNTNDEWPRYTLSYFIRKPMLNKQHRQLQICGWLAAKLWYEMTKFLLLGEINICTPNLCFCFSFCKQFYLNAYNYFARVIWLIVLFAIFICMSYTFIL